MANIPIGILGRSVRDAMIISFLEENTVKFAGDKETAGWVTCRKKAHSSIYPKVHRSKEAGHDFSTDPNHGVLCSMKTQPYKDSKLAVSTPNPPSAVERRVLRCCWWPSAERLQRQKRQFTHEEVPCNASRTMPEVRASRSNYATKAKHTN